jgi:hypothetical protein
MKIRIGTEIVNGVVTVVIRKGRRSISIEAESVESARVMIGNIAAAMANGMNDVISY